VGEAPKTLVEAIRYFSDPDVAFEFMVALRWSNGVECPACGSKKVGFLASRWLFQCKTRHPKQQFSVKVGTILEDSPIGLDKWLPAIWMIANAKNGISSYELHRALGVTQKTAWFMLHRIRLAMQSESFEKMGGQMEADETYIGGKARNMHRDERAAEVKGRGGNVSGKAIVMGVLERKSQDKISNVRLKVIPDNRRSTVRLEVIANVEPGSALFTDALASYTGLDRECAHGVIDHAEAYVRGNVHTNGLENFWSLLKRI
jgi:transposase-like protein